MGFVIFTLKYLESLLAEIIICLVLETEALFRQGVQDVKGLLELVAIYLLDFVGQFPNKGLDEVQVQQGDQGALVANHLHHHFLGCQNKVFF